MAIDFPASPTVGQTFTSGGMVYVYNGTGWTVKGGATTDFVMKTGDTMTGNLSVPVLLATGGFVASYGQGGNSNVGSLNLNAAGTRQLTYNGTDFLLTGAPTQIAEPIIATHAATKQYVDAVRTYAAPLDALAYSGMQVNGSCQVSQESGGGAVTAINNGDKYILDGWIISYSKAGAVITGQQAGGPSPPIWTMQSIELKATTAVTGITPTDNVVIRQHIEGYRMQRLQFGYSPIPVTIGFWIKATVAGTMGVTLHNGAFNRSCVSNITLAANTWEWKTITFVGDATGSWDIANGRGLVIDFCGAVGTTYQAATPNVWQGGLTFGTAAQTNFLATNNNTINVAGLVVLPGTQAPTAAQSPLIMRPYDQELLLCKRYFQWVGYGIRGEAVSSTKLFFSYSNHIPLRASPTVTVSAVSPVIFRYSTGGAGITVGITSNDDLFCTANGGRWGWTLAGSVTIGERFHLETDNMLKLDARL